MGGSSCRVTEVPRPRKISQGLRKSLLALAADTLADERDEAAFGILAELVVPGCLFAYDDAPTTITRVKPFSRRHSRSAVTVEAYAGPHLDKGSALGKFSRLLEFHADQGETLIVFEDTNGTDRHFVARFSQADGAPISGG